MFEKNKAGQYIWSILGKKVEGTRRGERRQGPDMKGFVDPDDRIHCRAVS